MLVNIDVSRNLSVFVLLLVQLKKIFFCKFFPTLERAVQPAPQGGPTCPHVGARWTAKNIFFNAVILHNYII